MSDVEFQEFVFGELDIKDEILIYRDMKPNRRTFFEIYADGSFFISSTITKAGLHLPVKLHNWFNLPKKRSDSSMNADVDYTFFNTNGTESLLSIKSEIYNNNYGTYVRPLIDLEQNMEISKKFKLGVLVKCKITLKVNEKKVQRNQFKEALKLIQDTNLDLKSSKLIISGNNFETKFVIYLNSDENVIIRQKGTKTPTNNLPLSTEINKYIGNLFDSNYKFLCKINNEIQLVVCSSIEKRKDRGLKKSILLPYTNSSKQVEIMITNPNLKLSEFALENYDMRLKLIKMGLPIISFKYNTSPKSEHVDREFEKQARSLIKKVILSLNGESYSEVELIREKNENENKLTTKYYADELGLINLKEKKVLILFEIKSSIQKIQKSNRIDVAISKIKNFVYKLNSSKVLSVLIINEDIRYKDKIITSEYGSSLNMIIIGKEDLNHYLNNHLLLKQKIQNLLIKRNNTQDVKRNSRLISKKVTNEILLKHKDILTSTLNPKAKINRIRYFSGQGAIFEKHIANQYENNGFEVITNLMIQLFRRNMELDLVTIRKKEVILISCKNMSRVRKIEYLITRIKENANLIEHRLKLLRIKKANIHIKVHSSVYNIIKNKINGYWVPNVFILIEK